MTGVGFDSAGAFVGKERDANLAHAKSLGGTHIFVYLVGTPGGDPCSSPADVAAIRAQGLTPVGNWERAADFFATATQADCFAAGREAAQAMVADGFPPGSLCAFSFDYDVPNTAASYASMLQKLAWCQQGMDSVAAGRFVAVPYGSAGLITYFATHAAPYVARGYKAWLSESTFDEPGYQDAFKYAFAVQNHHADGTWFDSPFPGCDVNTILDPAALGAWGPPNQPRNKTEDDMAFRLIQRNDGTSKGVYAYHPAGLFIGIQDPNWLKVAFTQADYQPGPQGPGHVELLDPPHFDQCQRFALSTHAAAVDPAAIATAVAQKLQASGAAGGLTEDQAKQAVIDAFAEMTAGHTTPTPTGA